MKDRSKSRSTRSCRILGYCHEPSTKQTGGQTGRASLAYLQNIPVLICVGLSPVKDLQNSEEYTIIESDFLRAVAGKNEPELARCCGLLARYFPITVSEESLRPVYVRLLQRAKEGSLPQGEGEKAAALIFKELGFFEPMPGLLPVVNCRKRSCWESMLFRALS